MNEQANTKRTRRTPEQIVADMEAELQAARARAAKAQAADSPETAEIREKLDGLKKDIRDAKRGLGNGPQSFDARRTKHLKWIDKIDEEQRQAEAILDRAETEKEALEAQLAEIVSTLVADA